MRRATKKPLSKVIKQCTSAPNPYYSSTLTSICYYNYNNMSADYQHQQRHYPTATKEEQFTNDPASYKNASFHQIKKLIDTPKPKLSQSDEPEWYERVNKWAEQIGVDSKRDNIEFIHRALTHPSFSKNTNKTGTNASLEFFGDRVLGFVLIDHFVRQNKYSTANLVHLCTSFESNDHLYNVGVSLGLADIIRGEFPSAQPPPTDTITSAISPEASLKYAISKNIIASAVEALIAALYMIKGDMFVADFIKKHVLPQSEELYMSHSKLANPRAALTDYLTSKGSGAPVYKILDEAGRMSAKSMFVVGVYSDGKMLGSGQDKSIRGAEIKAAQVAADALRIFAE